MVVTTSVRVVDRGVVVTTVVLVVVAAVTLAVVFEGSFGGATTGGVRITCERPHSTLVKQRQIIVNICNVIFMVKIVMIY